MKNSSKSKVIKSQTSELSLDNLSKSGVKAQLTQNDIIEIVAEERFNELMKEVHEINDFKNNCDRIINKIIENKALNILKDHNITLNKYQFGINNYERPLSIPNFTFSGDNMYGYTYCNFRSSENIRVFVSSNPTLELDETSKTPFKYYSALNEKFSFEFKYSDFKKELDPIYDRIEAVSKRVVELNSIYGDKKLTFDKVLRVARTTLNKKILKEQNVDLLKTIENIYNVTL